MGRCSVEDCEKDAKHLGFCTMHYARVHRYGDPSTVKRQQRINAKKRYRKEYNSWRAMKDRCLTPTNEWYGHYGGRGIKICDEWLGPYGFDNFIKDMGERPKGFSIDRIDVNGDYCPENCRWANQSQQMNNTRVNRRFMAFGKKGTFTELFRLFAPDDLKKKTAERRFYEMGWSIEQAITTLPMGRG